MTSPDTRREGMPPALAFTLGWCAGSVIWLLVVWVVVAGTPAPPEPVADRPAAAPLVPAFEPMPTQGDAPAGRH
jgi:hypothetical protein